MKEGSMQRTSDLASVLARGIEDGALPGNVEVAMEKVSIEDTAREGSTHVLIAMLTDEAWKVRDGMELEMKELERVEEEKRRGRRIILWRGILLSRAGLTEKVGSEAV
jgi:hypothetical protein